MDAACTIQDSIHVFSLVHKYVSRILGTYQNYCGVLRTCKIFQVAYNEKVENILGGIRNADRTVTKRNDSGNESKR